jgi:tetratricopeptide (TPR) repeat protein
MLSLPAQGNARYRCGDLEGALAAYAAGVELDESSSELVALLSNRSACLCDLGRWDEALADARRCVLVGPKPETRHPKP